ncbi:MAG: hypothetical protein NVS2B12_03480 [Ktedonobacteraceae bacterium]
MHLNALAPGIEQQDRDTLTVDLAFQRHNQLSLKPGSVAGVFWVKRTEKAFSPLFSLLVNFLAQALRPHSALLYKKCTVGTKFRQVVEKAQRAT